MAIFRLDARRSILCLSRVGLGCIKIFSGSRRRLLVISRSRASLPSLTQHFPQISPRTTTQVRGKKTKTTISFEDLPQGPIPSPTEELEEAATTTTGANDTDEKSKKNTKAKKAEPEYPTVIQQARRNMDKLSNCILLTRVGGFYEMYFEHADDYAPLLNLKVAQKKTNARPVSMAGFPFFQLDRFLKTLVQDLNRSVAIAEEFPNDPSAKVKSGGLMHDRRVTRVITPGTLIDENFIDPYTSNYVLSIYISESDAGATVEGEDPSHSNALENEEDIVSALLPPPELTLGLAWLDLSTGQFYVQTCLSSSLSSVISRITPRELVLDKALESDAGNRLVSLLTEDRQLVAYSPKGDRVEPSDWTSVLETPISESVLESLSSAEVEAGNLLLNYVKDRLRGLSMKLQPPVRYQDMQIMAIDKSSMRALEIKQTMRDGVFRGSLLHAIRRTVTKGGARLLNEWLSAPSTSLNAISGRQDLVEIFLYVDDLRQTVLQLLKRCHDSQRLVQKFALGRGDPDDLLSLASTIYATEEMCIALKNAVSTMESGSVGAGELSPSSFSPTCINILVTKIRLTGPLQLARRIRDAIDQEGLETQHQLQDRETGAMLALAEEVVTTQGSGEDAAAVLPKKDPSKKKRQSGAASIREYYASDTEAWMMRPDASAALSRLHSKLRELAGEKMALEESLRKRFSAPTLTLKWTPMLGHICHVKGKDAKALPATPPPGEEVPIVVSSSRSTRSLHVSEWTTLGNRLDQVRIRIRAEENRVFSSLRQAVIRNLVPLRRNAAVLEEMDVAVGFAGLAEEQGLVRPILRNDPLVGHNIVGGRHPTVEKGLSEQGRSFVGNDCFVGSGSGQHGRSWLITGPNMAGKSTFLRQNALITILAQVGCFVPADFAEIGIVDAMFSRMGSADSLYHGQSTFMVEMMETAAILRNATPRSFVIMDEVGRGTQPEDGTAIAFACLHHLTTVNKCRSLFATHFHKITDLVCDAGLDVPTGGPVDMYCTDIEENEETGDFVYIHRLRKGINRRSHALKVAQVAGIPKAVLATASKIMADVCN